MPDERLDRALALRGLCRSRTQAAQLIRAGRVRVDAVVRLRPSHIVEDGARIELEAPAFVSRGGDKLQHALERFAIDPDGLTALDLGASTGGFTDCLLQRGARRVYAVDVGEGQLDPRIAGDARVTALPGVNARALAPELLGGRVELCVIDLSFISLGLVWPAVRRCVRDDAQIVALVKPQFEAGRAALNKQGVVRAASDHLRALDGAATAARESGLYVHRTTHSPLRGGSGNIEFLLHLRPFPPDAPAPQLRRVVAVAHAAFRRKPNDAET